jgi:hypothetical protein
MRNGGPDKKLWQNYGNLNFYLWITGIRKIRENYENGKSFMDSPLQIFIYSFGNPLTRF